MTVHDEWKIVLVPVLVEVERVKMVVVCRSADTVEHLGWRRRGWIILKCYVDCVPAVCGNGRRVSWLCRTHSEHQLSRSPRLLVIHN